MTQLILRGEFITLAHALKAAGLAESGGQSKHVIREGMVTVNGLPEIKPGRKLRAGDRFAVSGQPEWTLSG